MSEYEHMLISAVRYALGRRTYIVELTVNYVIKELPRLSDSCKKIMLDDITEHERFGYGDACDERDWMRLLDALRSEKRIGVIVNEN